MKFSWRILVTRQLISAVVALFFAILGEWVRPGLMEAIQPHVVTIVLALVGSSAAVDYHAYRRSHIDDEYMHWDREPGGDA